MLPAIQVSTTLTSDLKRAPPRRAQRRVRHILALVADGVHARAEREAPTVARPRLGLGHAERLRDLVTVRARARIELELGLRLGFGRRLGLGLGLGLGFGASGWG